MAAASSAPPGAAPAEALCDSLQRRLMRWHQLGEAAEYYDLLNRGPYKPTVIHALNRFGGQMGPYVDARLQLRSVEYINASPIDNVGAPKFVATMCPKRETFAHFWSMVWELGATVVVNLTHERDKVGSEPTDKRERYWPPFDAPAGDEAWPVRPRTVGCDACEQVPGLERYTIELTGPADGVHGGAAASRTVSLYWYSRWVDFPNSASIGSKPFYANAWNALHIALHVLPLLRARGDDHWTVCHCSAGVGRTGTFIALLHVLLRLPALRAIGALDGALRETIEAMRERRLWMVKTDVEFATLYAAILLQLRNLNLADFELSWRATMAPPPDGAPPPADAAADAAPALAGEAQLASADGGDGGGDGGDGGDGDGDGARKNLPSPHPPRPGKNIPVRDSPHSDIYIYIYILRTL